MKLRCQILIALAVLYSLQCEDEQHVPDCPYDKRDKSLKNAQEWAFELWVHSLDEVDLVSIGKLSVFLPLSQHRPILP